MPDKERSVRRNSCTVWIGMLKRRAIIGEKATLYRGIPASQEQKNEISKEHVLWRPNDSISIQPLSMN